MAIIVNVSEAKAQLSRLIDRVHQGEKITIAKNNLPVADLVAHVPSGQRKLGILQGQLDIPEDFLDDDTEIEEMFYGERP